MRTERPYTYLATTRGLCRECRAIVPARLLEQAGQVWQERLCPACGSSRALIADDFSWYVQRSRQTVAPRPSHRPGRPVEKGCPYDCGPCRFHVSACHLPILSITNACNLECPICFTYNRPDPLYFMTREELRELLDTTLARTGPVDLINLTGGEPTLHPHLCDLLAECQRPEIGRITVNTNGLRLAEDRGLGEALARHGVYVILSFNTFDGDRSRQIHGADLVGAKLAALKNLQDCGVGTTLLNVMIRGVNEDEIGDVIRLSREYSVVRSVTVQTMTFTGRGGKDFRPRQHLPLDAAARSLEKATSGMMKPEHFVPLPSAHPLCYSIACYLRAHDEYYSFTELLPPEQFRELLAGGYLPHPDGAAQEFLKEALDRLWAEGRNQGLLHTIRQLITELYPSGRKLTRFERQRLAEGHILTVYLHSHMDEDTLDLARLVACPDQVPDAEGRLIPACAYNLFYRMKDERFWIE
jgi:uncharacterized radical SAM superfamily Fe-S cluster-containing enzyme